MTDRRGGVVDARGDSAARSACAAAARLGGAAPPGMHGGAARPAREARPISQCRGSARAHGVGLARIVASNRWVNLLVDLARALVSSQRAPSRQASGRAPEQPSGQPSPEASRQASPRTSPQDSRRPSRDGGDGTPPASDTYPGDYRGTLRPEYAADLDGEPDPGEIVWTWVPYEEDHSQGKDRPVLLVGRDGPWLLALQLTSKDHDRDHAQEARAGRYWMDIGTGAWDKQGRPSELRLNRVIRVAPDAVRREGAVLPRELFSQVVAEMQRVQG